LLDTEKSWLDTEKSWLNTEKSLLDTENRRLCIRASLLQNPRCKFIDLMLSSHSSLLLGQLFTGGLGEGEGQATCLFQ
jgi:hypothetical protein